MVYDFGPTKDKRLGNTKALFSKFIDANIPTRLIYVSRQLTGITIFYLDIKL